MSVTKIKRYTPASGDTITMENFDERMIIIIAPATEITVLNIVWNSSPNNGDKVEIYATQKIDKINHSGATLNENVTIMPACSSVRFMYDASVSTYMIDGMYTGVGDVSLPFTATVAGGAGNAVCYLTDSGLVGGSQIFSSVEVVMASFDIADPNYDNQKPVISNSNKTCTIYCVKQTFTGITLLSTPILGSVAIAAAPDGTVLSLLVTGKLL